MVFEAELAISLIKLAEKLHQIRSTVYYTLH